MLFTLTQYLCKNEKQRNLHISVISGFRQGEFQKISTHVKSTHVKRMYEEVKILNIYVGGDCLKPEGLILKVSLYCF